MSNSVEQGDITREKDQFSSGGEPPDNICNDLNDAANENVQNITLSAAGVETLTSAGSVIKGTSEISGSSSTPAKSFNVDDSPVAAVTNDTLLSSVSLLHTKCEPDTQHCSQTKSTKSSMIVSSCAISSEIASSSATETVQSNTCMNQFPLKNDDSVEGQVTSMESKDVVSNTNRDVVTEPNTSVMAIPMNTLEQSSDTVQSSASSMSEHICKWDWCYQIFLTLEMLSNHVNDAHVSVDCNEVYRCRWQDCPRKGRTFNARYKILSHMRTHTNEKPHVCLICQKPFARLENLKIHNRTHTGEKPYACPYEGCMKAYSNSSDRFKHTLTHRMDRPYGCKMPGCDKRYTDPSSLRKHVRTHGHVSKVSTDCKMGSETAARSMTTSLSTTSMNKTTMSVSSTDPAPSPAFPYAVNVPALMNGNLCHIPLLIANPLLSSATVSSVPAPLFLDIRQKPESNTDSSASSTQIVTDPYLAFRLSPSGGLESSQAQQIGQSSQVVSPITISPSIDPMPLMLIIPDSTGNSSDNNS